MNGLNAIKDVKKDFNEHELLPDMSDLTLTLILTLTLGPGAPLRHD